MVGVRKMVKDPAGYLPLTIGLCSLLFQKWLSDFAVRSQNKTWGFNFGVKERRIFQFAFIVVGIGFIFLGILILLGFVHFKNHV